MKLTELPAEHSIRSIHRDAYFEFEERSVRRDDLGDGERYIGRVLVPLRSRSLQAYATDFLIRVNDAKPPKQEGFIIEYPVSVDIAGVDLSLLDARGEAVDSISDVFMDAVGALSVPRLWRPLPFRSHNEAGYLMKLPEHMNTTLGESLAQVG